MIVGRCWTRKEKPARGKQVFGPIHTDVNHGYIFGEIVHGRKGVGLKMCCVLLESDATIGVHKYSMM